MIIIGNYKMKCKYHEFIQVNLGFKWGRTINRFFLPFVVINFNSNCLHTVIGNPNDFKYSC